MYPILFRIGSYTVFSYTVATALGILAGVWLACRLSSSRTLQPRAVLDAAFWALLGGIAGARVGYVIPNWAYYRDHIDKAVRLSDGGLSWHGALIGGILILAGWLAVRRPFRSSVPDWRDLLDVLSPGLALGSALGWVGCLLTGCGYGAEASGYPPPQAWLTAWLPDIYGVQADRFLTQPLMIAWCLILCVALGLLLDHLPRGSAFACLVFLYAVADFGVAFLRGDGTWRRGLWLSQWAALAEMCTAAGLAIWVWTHRRRGPGLLLPGREEGMADACDHPDH